MATNLNFLCFACLKASFTVFIICLFLSGRLIVTQTNRRAREWRGPSTWRSSLILMLNLEGGGAWYSKSVKTFIWGMGLSLSHYLLHFPLSCVFPAPQPILSLPSPRNEQHFFEYYVPSVKETQAFIWILGKPRCWCTRIGQFELLFSGLAQSLYRERPQAWDEMTRLQTISHFPWKLLPDNHWFQGRFTWLSSLHLSPGVSLRKCEVPLRTEFYWAVLSDLFRTVSTPWLKPWL